MGDSIRIVDKNEKDIKKSIAIILNEAAYDQSGNYSEFTKGVIREAKDEGKCPVIIKDWEKKLG